MHMVEADGTGVNHDLTFRARQSNTCRDVLSMVVVKTYGWNIQMLLGLASLGDIVCVARE